MSNEMSFDSAIDSLYQIMLNEWSKEEIIEYMRSRDGYTKNDMTAIIPTVAVMDTPIKHGYWQRIMVQPYFRKHFAIDVACSLCHRRGDERYNFCPNCGAKMDGKEQNDE